MITHPELDILEYQVKWVLASITTNQASGGDEIPVELLQILKDDAVKVLHSTSEGFLDLGAAWDGGSWKVLDEDLGPVDPRTLERTGMEGFFSLH